MTTDHPMKTWMAALVIACLLNAGTLTQPYDAAGAADPGNLLQLVGNALTGPSLDFCGEPLPLDNAEVRERFEREMLLTLWNRPLVIYWLTHYGRYIPQIEKMLKDQSLPDDLKYIVIVESSLKPYAVSPKGATGFWQFMDATGSRYGLTINPDKDDRRNLVRSTAAAMNYLKAIHKMLHSWTLAAAAFNMGEEGLKTEIMLQGVNDYYKLYLPVETQRYIFRIITAKLILMNPDQYGFLPVQKTVAAPDRIELACQQRVPLRLIAEAARTYFKVIKDLNPEIRGHYLPAGTHTLLVPGGSGAGFSERYEKCLNKWLTDAREHQYTVKKGDNLSSLAARFNIPVRAIVTWNRLGSAKKPLVPGEKLIIFTDDATLEKTAQAKP